MLGEPSARNCCPPVLGDDQITDLRQRRRGETEEMDKCLLDLIIGDSLPLHDSKCIARL